MSPAQVAVQVRARAESLAIEDYPGRTTVYRILRPHIEQQQQKRSLGWRQDRLTLNTREGLAIGIEWSNQVWQVDHTRADVLGHALQKCGINSDVIPSPSMIG